MNLVPGFAQRWQQVSVGTERKLLTSSGGGPPRFRFTWTSSWARSRAFRLAGFPFLFHFLCRPRLLNARHLLVPLLVYLASSFQGKLSQYWRMRCLPFATRLTRRPGCRLGGAFESRFFNLVWCGIFFFEPEAIRRGSWKHMFSPCFPGAGVSRWGLSEDRLVGFERDRCGGWAFLKNARTAR